MVTGWEHLEAVMPLERCPEDRHVLALAQFVGAQIVVTDEKDLIVEINALSGETWAMSADAFGCELLARRGTDALRGVIETMAAERRRPPHAEADVWTVLADQVGGLLGLARLYQENLGLPPPT